ncbi:MAG: hypothetical protein U9P80_04980, partial [Thermodesulfobacteriota bacterium]|nr:hypothetical protein [Thermodesulfobacteriota bacterium]
MEAGIFALSALVALFGFLVIFFRTRSIQGLYAAFVMLGGFVLEICYLFYSRDGDLWVLKAALFFELVTVSAVIFFVVSLQARSMQANLFMIWLRRVSLSLSLCFGFILLCFPDMTITMILPQLVVTGPMGQIQSIMVICGAVFFMWIVENMIRAGNDNSLRIMRYPAIGIVVIGASFCLNAIYRLSTLTISSEVLGLSSLIMLCGFLLIIFFSVRYRLFEMNIFVSRYVVYHSVTLLAVGAYVLIMGLILVGVKRLGMEISFLS